MIRRIARKLGLLFAVLVLIGACEVSAPAAPASPVATALASGSVTTASHVPNDPTPRPATTSAPSVAPSSTSTPSPRLPSIAGWPYETDREILQTLFEEDGHVVVVEADRMAGRSYVTVLDEEGRRATGWPWSIDTGDAIAEAGLGPEGSIYVALRGSLGRPGTWSWALHRLSPAGADLPGFPVDLPPVSFCDLAVSEMTGIAYVTCQEENADGGVATVLTTVEASGFRPYPPLRLAEDASVIGFTGDDRGPLLAIQNGGPRMVLRALLPNGDTAWSKETFGGDAFIDAVGWIRVTRHEFKPDACGAPTKTTYDLVSPFPGDDGPQPGWPLTVRGWASGPAVYDNGSMVVLTDDDRALRYSRSGALEAGWPAKVDVAYGCSGGTRPVRLSSGRTLVVGAREVTVLRSNGEVASGWPVDPPGMIAMSCPSCTPGADSPFDPGSAGRTMFLGTYDGRGRPRVVGLDWDGSVATPAAVVGDPGDELTWISMAPLTGRVWAVSMRWPDETVHSRLTLVADP